MTDQTSAHDPVNGYLPAGWTLAEWEDKRASDPRAVEATVKVSMRIHVEPNQLHLLHSRPLRNQVDIARPYSW